VADTGTQEARCLEEWLRARRIEASVEVIDRATVGLSQETWLLRVTTASKTADVVLRLPTPASGIRSILTQRAALQAVEGSAVRAPELLWHDDSDQTPFERPFIVMARVPGVVPVGWHELEEPRRMLLAEQAIDLLAALHAIDVAGTELAARGPSPLLTLDGLERLYERLRPLPSVVSAALWWLHRHTPDPGSRQVLVHGDYRMGNMVVDGDRIAGVLDWEMAAPGDPIVDLAWCFIPVWEPAGLDEEALVRRYREQTGEPDDSERFHWHRVLGYVRLAYYALAGTRTFDAGRSGDLRLAALRLQLPVTLDRLAATLAREPVT
jgi:aminoglycoside phosphotransferase (APT) family kinase protein